ncbi:hypothetical protein [Mycolicibacterium gilvum]|uniref:hypothetical protein n=1 Tax=Mycolicibacterium gilvum TaxID=1804 RepID=UPI0040460D48
MVNETAVDRRTGRRSLETVDMVFAVLVVAFSTAAAIAAMHQIPAEDAAMLLRYSDNVGHGFGIVYNPGGERVDGASDLLFMLAVGGLAALGITPVAGAALVNSAALVVLLGCVYTVWGRWGGVTGWQKLVPPLLVPIGPAFVFIQTGFATVPFAAAAVCATALVEGWCRTPRPLRYRVLVAIALAVLSLSRLEGFFLAALLLAVIVWRRRSLDELVAPVLLLVGIGVAWFAWRWSYFGYPLPNPFYKKGGGSLYLASLEPAVKGVVILALPWIVVQVLAVWVPSLRRIALGWLIVASAWAAVWVLLSNEMNYLWRFQYAIVGVLAVAAASVYPTMRTYFETRSDIWARGVPVALVLAMLLAVTWPTSAASRYHDAGIAAHRAAATALRDVGPGTGSLATTEAGLVALESGWNVIDLWGLNDKQIAHQGHLDPQQLAQKNIDVIFSHVPHSSTSVNPNDSADQFLPGWTEMTDPLMCFADANGYELLAEKVVGRDDAYMVLAAPQYGRADLLRDRLVQLGYSHPSLGAKLVDREVCR